jgi:hypothetical protein
MNDEIIINGLPTGLTFEKLIKLVEISENEELEYLLVRWENRKNSTDKTVLDFFKIELIEALVFAHAPCCKKENGRINNYVLKRIKK